MSQLDPANTTIGDLCNAALKECGWIGVGQTPLAEDTNDAWARLQWMLQQWQEQRWMVYHLVDLSKTSTGANTYTLGPGGDIDTGASTMRPAKLEAAFLRQLTQSQPNQIDYPLEILQSYEDYSRIALKQLMSFPGYIFLDSAFPLGVLHTYPVPQANIYAVHVIVRAPLPIKFPTLATVIVLPYEYYDAILFNLALRLRAKYQIPPPPGDQLPMMAKAALNVVRAPNAQISRLAIPNELKRNGIYNIFSDRSY